MSLPAFDIMSFIDMVHIPMFILGDPPAWTPGGEWQTLPPADRVELIYLNDAAADLAGLDRAACIGAILGDILPTRHARLMSDHCDTCMRTLHIEEFETIIRPHQDERWLRTALSPMPAGLFASRAVLGTLTNMTDCKQREFQAIEQTGIISERYDALKLIATMTAHDMRTPLGNVRSLVDMVLEDVAGHGDDTVEMIRMCGHVADEALTQIDSIMVQAGRLDRTQIELEPVDLGRTCKDITALIDPVGRLDITQPTTEVMTDLVLLQMVLRNLLDNARRFCTRRITIEFEDAPDRQDHFRLLISDDGPGFLAPGGLDGSIAAAREKSQTRGFGLDAVRTQLESRDGGLSLLAPRDGYGTTLCVTLPGTVISADGGHDTA